MIDNGIKLKIYADHWIITSNFLFLLIFMPFCSITMLFLPLTLYPTILDEFFFIIFES